ALMGHLRTADAGISGQRFAARCDRARSRGASVDVWMGTIYRKAGTHDRHENVWSIGTTERTPEEIRLRARPNRSGCETIAHEELGLWIQQYWQQLIRQLFRFSGSSRRHYQPAGLAVRGGKVGVMKKISIL